MIQLYLYLGTFIMPLRIISDIHLESCQNYLIAEMAGEDQQILILAGDIYPYFKTAAGNRRDFFEDISSRFKKVIYVPGNHEYYFGDFNHGDDILREYFSEFPNIHFLNGEYIEVDGIRILGCALWTEIDPVTEAHLGRSFSDYNVITSGDGLLTPPQTVFIHRAHKKFLLENTNKDSIVVTHHCPSYQSMHTKFKNSELNSFFYNKMDEEILELQPRLWVHGHTHCSMNYKIGETRVICNPKGYYNPYQYDDPENPSFDEFFTF